MEARLKPIEVAGQRILTTKALAEGYGTTPDSISYNFNRNREHYAEGKHFYCLEAVSYTHLTLPTNREV